MNYEQKHNLLGEYFFCKRSTTLLHTSKQQTREAMQIRSKDRVIGAPKIKSGRPISEEVKFSTRFCGLFRLVLSARRERRIRGHQKRFLLLNLRDCTRSGKKNVLLNVRILFVHSSAPATQRFVRPKWHTRSLSGHRPQKLQSYASCHRLRANYRRTAATNCVQHRKRKRNVELLSAVSQQGCPSEHFGERSRYGQS